MPNLCAVLFSEFMLKRYSQNPIIKPLDIQGNSPELQDVSSVFNPGAIKIGNEYILLLRVQNRGRQTFLVLAKSNDGIHFDIEKKAIPIKGLDSLSQTVYHIYDPRITKIEDKYHIMVAMDLDGGCQLGLITTVDFRFFQFEGIVSESENRNGVLFPEMINGKYVRLDRPNTSTHGGVSSGSHIHLSWSLDGIDWSRSTSIMSGNPHYWDELIGAGTPPIKTKEGWLFLYHGVATHFAASNIYQMGVVLLDLENPSKILARTSNNILEPRELYEQVGQVNNVVFPTGIVVEDVDEDGTVLPHSEVKIYYGAADTCVCLATSTISELIDMAKNE